MTPRGRRPASRLSRREQEIVDLLETGLGHKQIAHKLQISIWTVRSHLANARREAGVSSNLTLVSRFSSRGRDLEEAFEAAGS